jgi:phosphatidylglycerol lysyltransferase
MARWRRAIRPFLNLALFGAAILVLDRLLAEYRYADIVDALEAVPAASVAAALGLTALGYLSLVGYDYLAFRFAGRPLPLRTMLLPSFVSFAVSNNAPAAVLAAGGLRYRLYAALGLTAREAVVIAGFNVVTYAVGLCALAGAALLLLPGGAPAGLGWIGLPGRALGMLLLLAVALYLGLTALPRRPESLKRFRLRLPPFSLSARQVAISVLDWLLSSAALYAVVSAVVAVPYASFLATFLTAQVATLIVPIPGGVGVFEAVMLLLRPGAAAPPRLLAALLIYRVVYYLVPLLLAGALIAVQEVRRARQRGLPVSALLARLTALAPHVLAFITFGAGLLLLLTGAIPTDRAHLAWLGDLLPLGVIELSHFLASIVGAALLILAWGLERRVRLAYHLTCVLIGLGVMLGLTRSLNLHLAALLTLVLALLVTAGKEFPRTTSLLTEPLSPGWGLAIAASALTALWAGRLAFRGQDYSRELWWRFALNGDAPRALRAAVGMGVVVVLFVLARVLVRLAPHNGGRTVGR